VARFTVAAEGERLELQNPGQKNREIEGDALARRNWPAAERVDG
jgi:hypothetical protein